MSAPADDAMLMLKAGGMVAAVAVPVAAACAWLSRLLRIGLCPPWRMPRFVWPGHVIFASFVVYHVGLSYLLLALDAGGFFRIAYPNGFPVPSVPEQQSRTDMQLKGMWAGLFLVPPLLLTALFFSTVYLRRVVRWADGWMRLPQTVALGTFGWVIFGWHTYALNLIIQAVTQAGGGGVEEHPLVLLGWRGDGYGGVVFVLSACVAGPLLEEFLFRGLLVSWAGGRWYRPWVLTCAAGGLAVMGGKHQTEAVVFVGMLGLILYGIQRFGKRAWRRMPKRTTLAIWSSSALFAAAHSSVWPTPIPLFVLGLGLGYLTARTRGWAAAAVCHMLFNTTSFVFLLLRG